MNKIIFALFASGLFLGAGPCLVTCGPILISYIAATRQNPKQGILVWFLFSMSRICVYLILSVSIFLLGEFLVKRNLIYIAKYIYLLGGMIIILIGIFIIIKDSAGTSRFCSIISERINQRLLKVQPITLGLIMGSIPCAPLLAVLSYIGLVSVTWQRCILYSLIFGLGTLISPLMLLALAAGFIPKILLNKPGVYRVFRIVCGFIIVFFGAQLVFQIAYGSIILP
jgi:ABC-type nickel/cobalt efflux system permease component RcnA